MGRALSQEAGEDDILSGITLMHLAAKEKNPACLKQLLASPAADPNVKEKARTRPYRQPAFLVLNPVRRTPCKRWPGQRSALSTSRGTCAFRACHASHAHPMRARALAVLVP